MVKVFGEQCGKAAKHSTHIQCTLALLNQDEGGASLEEEEAPARILVEVQQDGSDPHPAVRGLLDKEHLSDHPAAAASLAAALYPGADLGRLLVLERLEVSSFANLDLGDRHFCLAAGVLL